MAVRKRKRAIIAISVVCIIAIIAATFTGILFGTNVFQNAIIKIACQDKPSSTPKNYDEILSATTLTSVEYTPGVYLDIIESHNTAADALCVLVFHGGYYVGGGRHNQEPFARYIASYGYRVLNVDYSLAPKYVYPTQLIQANKALNYAEQRYPQSKGYVVTGDSAGAHLSGQLAALVGSAELRQKRNIDVTVAPQRLLGFVGNCGFYEASTVKETGFFLVGSAMQMLVGERDYKNSDVISELDLVNYASSFPATLLICGDKDPFITQNTAMYQKLTAANIKAEQYFPASGNNKLGHEFQCNYKIEESYTAMDKIIQFMENLD